MKCNYGVITCIQHPGQVFRNGTVLVGDGPDQHPGTDHRGERRSYSLTGTHAHALYISVLRRVLKTVL